MFCENCGKEISNESRFCKFCGATVIDGGVKKSEEKDESPKKQKNNSKTIWDSFAEIYDSRGEERDRYNDLSSNEAWELINRLGKNTFEGFIEENKEQLNKQPYKVLESLENMLKYAVIGGYWLWTAEHILKNGNSWKLKTINLDNLIKEWTEEVKGLGTFIKKISPDLDDAFNRYQNFKMNSFLEEAPTIKDLPVEFIEKIKLELLTKILWGYCIGVSESKYIK